MASREEQFWSRVQRVPDGCWLWLGKGRLRNYGFFTFGGERLAHRAAYLLANGSIDKQLCVCHKCDNPTCVRPSHLFQGTQLENVADRHAKKRDRAPRGEESPKAKLTESDVLYIVAQHARGRSKNSLAVQFHVDPRTVDFVVNGTNWGWLTGIVPAQC